MIGVICFLVTMISHFAIFNPYANFLLYYLIYILSSVVLPGLYFLVHPQIFKDSLKELYGILKF